MMIISRTEYNKSETSTGTIKIDYIYRGKAEGRKYVNQIRN